MTNVQAVLPSDEGSSRIKTHEMYKRLMTVAELLKRSAHQQAVDSIETKQPEREKTQERKAVVS